MRLLASGVALLVLLAAGPAAAQPQPPARPPPAEPSASPGERGREGADKAEEIITQPARDLGVSKVEIPPLLVAASAEPYSLQGLGTCKLLAAEVGRLNEVLGPDLDRPRADGENKAERLAVAGGKTVVNSFLPFRSLVREFTGAAPAQRALNAALEAGFARRGFLRGVHRTRGCKTAF